MFNYIKWFFLVFGGFRFGIAGAILGFFLGYIIEEIFSGKTAVNKNNSKQKFAFPPKEQNILLLIASVIKADGYISKEKILFTNNFIYKTFGAVTGSRMMIALKDLIQKSIPVEDVATALRFSIERDQKLKLLHFFYNLSMVNGYLHPNEKKIIEHILINMGLFHEDFENMTKGRQQSKKNPFNFNYSSDHHYKILGLTKQASNEEIKKTYRKLVLKYHPDRSKGMDKSAEAKFVKIQDAYEQIKKARNIK